MSMRYEIVGKGHAAKTAFLCPRIQTSEINKHYVEPHLNDMNEEFVVCNLFLDRSKKKTPVKQIKEYLDDLLPELQAMGIEMLVVTQPEYFKVLAKVQKTDATIGDVLDGVGGFKVTYCPLYTRIFYDPDKTKQRIGLAMEAVKRWYNGDTSKRGGDIIHHAEYPNTVEEIEKALQNLMDMNCDLTCDIEGFSLKHYDCGVGTITFCWSEHEGIAFAVDFVSQTNKKGEQVGGIQIKNPEIRALLRDFFVNFEKKMIYHNICFDVYVLVYQLFMDHLLDQEGLLYGLEVLLKNWECTQIITYLATNSCAGNELGLKAQAHEFAGNYAVEEIHDITLIPLDTLLRYNLIDGLSTWYVYKKHLPTVINDKQLDIYMNLFKPAVVDIIQMQLSGLPINMDKVKKLDKKLNSESESIVERLRKTSIAKGFLTVLEDEAIVVKNQKLKTKQVTRADLGSTKDLTVEFNPGSAPQLQKLLYDSNFLGLPILDYTSSRLPATGAETLEKLLAQGVSNEVKEFIELLMEFKALAIIISTFLPAMLKAQQGNDGWYYLFGNFRLGGTLSGRLSSNNPNLQNIPSSAGAPLKKRLAKMIKECFEAPPGWLFVGLDFDSLEDKISAVTTRDPEKIKVYSDGYDGHSIRALAYFGNEMPDIELAPEEGEAFKAEDEDGNALYFHSDEEIEYLGTTMTGAEFALLINSGNKQL